MLMREVVAAHTVDGGHVLLPATLEMSGRLELGDVARRDGSDAPSPKDVVVVGVSEAVTMPSRWPTDLPLGARVVAVVDHGIGDMPVVPTLESAGAAGLAIVDAIEVSDIGTSALAIVAVRSDVAVAPRPWRTGTYAPLADDADRQIRRAVGAHVLSRSIDVQRFEFQLFDLHQVRRERDELATRIATEEEMEPVNDDPVDMIRVLGGMTLTELVTEYSTARRTLAAVHRSRTWRVGRVFWGLVHPVRAWREASARTD